MNWLAETGVNGENPTASELKMLRLLSNLVLVTALLPYVSPMPVRLMDVQITCHVASILAVLALLLFAPRRLDITRTDLLLLLAGVAALFYVDYTRVNLDISWLRNCGTILIAFPVYYAVRILYRYMSPKLFVGIVVLYVVVIVFEVTFPSIYFPIFNHLLNEVRWEPGSVRGPNGLCVEPSMVGNMAVLFSIAPWFFKQEFWEQNPRARWLVFSCSAILLIMSHSASGFVVAAVVLACAVATSRLRIRQKVIIAASMCAVFLITGAALQNSDSRAAYISLAIKNPALALQDPSLGQRSINAYLAVYGLSQAPLGTGRIVIDQRITDPAWSSDLMKATFQDPDLLTFLRHWSRETSFSGIGSSIHRMGFLFVVILFGLTTLIRGVPRSGIIRVFFWIVLLNGALITPTYWLIFGCCTAQRDASSGSGLKPEKWAD
jgi:hypothetical protein